MEITRLRDIYLNLEQLVVYGLPYPRQLLRMPLANSRSDPSDTLNIP